MTMVQQVPEPQFSADRPINSTAEDRLNRVEFATALGRSIVAWDGSDSLVVGLYGEWGCGKTSILNMAVEQALAARPATNVIKFNPWEWSGHEELATAFFREIESTLGQTSEQSALAERFKRYASALNVGAIVSDSITPIVAAVSVVLVATGGLAILGSPIAGGVLAGFGAIGIILSRVKKVMEALSSTLRRQTAESKSLSDAKQELTAALRGLDHNILVIVDDLDRLTPPDAVKMLQLIKANADFPRMVFLLAYDLTSLGESVQAALRVDGKDYIEKIVQVPIRVPIADRPTLEKLLTTGLDEILEQFQLESRWDQARWVALFLDRQGEPGINSFFTTPRGVFRFLSSLRFDLARQMDRGQCNVDPVDFIGIEVLRVFEPVAYDSLVTAKNLLTGPATGEAREQSAAKAEVDRLLEVTLQGPRRLAVQHILTELFPPATWALTGAQHSGDFKGLLADRRVSNGDMFDFYVQMAVPPASLSVGEISEIVARASQSQKALTDSLTRLIEERRISVFMRDVSAGPERIPNGQETIVIASLFDVGDSLESPVERMLEIRDSLLALSIIEDLLKRLPLAERGKTLEHAIANTRGVALPLEFIGHELHRLDRERETVIDDEAFLRGIGRRASERVRELAANQELLQHRHLAELLFSWKEFGDMDEVRRWADQQAAAPEGLLRLFQAFVGYAGSAGRHPLSDYIDLAAAVARIEGWVDSGEVATGIAEGLQSAVSAVRERYDV